MSSTMVVELGRSSPSRWRRRPIASESESCRPPWRGHDFPSLPAGRSRSHTNKPRHLQRRGHDPIPSPIRPKENQHSQIVANQFPDYASDGGEVFGYVFGSLGDEVFIAWTDGPNAADLRKRRGCHLFRRICGTAMLENRADVRFLQPCSATLSTNTAKLKEIHTMSPLNRKRPPRRSIASNRAKRSHAPPRLPFSFSKSIELIV